MPVTPPTGTPPYDNMSTILDMARVRLNDAIQDIGGDVLTNTAVFTRNYVNLAWRRLQEELSDLGSARFKADAYLLGIPPVGTIDPGTQCYINWSEYFDGANYYQYPDVPVLPGDLMDCPLRVWQRPAGAATQYFPMTNGTNAIIPLTKVGFSRQWEWREDALYFTGALQAIDLWIEYRRFLPDFADDGNTSWYDLPVPIVRCADALSWYIVAEVGGARGDVDVEVISARATSAAYKIANRQFSARQRINQRRQSYRSLSAANQNWNH